MKKFLSSIILLSILLTTSVSNITAQCTNGNWESGNFTNWKAYTGTNSSSGINLGAITPGVVNGRHTIMNSGNYDPIVGGTTLPVVNQGNHSVRLGNSSTGAQADLLTYTVSVTSQNPVLTFRFAMVMQDPGHPNEQNPFFSYLVYDGTTLNSNFSNLITGHQYIADLGDPFYKQVSGTNVVYRDWTPVCIDLSSYIGKNVTILFAAADCNQGGHYGYAYIDALCEDNSAVAKLNIPTTICQSDPIIGDGSQSTNETKHFWSVVETNAQGTPIGPEKYDWYYGQAGWMDLRAFYTARGGTFECDKYYRIKVAVSNDCTVWSEDTKLVHIVCPDFDAGQDIVLCCDNLPPFIILGNQDYPVFDDYDYQWWYQERLIGTGPLLNIPTPNGSGTYTLTVTDPATGCTGTMNVNVLIMGNYTIQITEDRSGACNGPITLTASIFPDPDDCDVNNNLKFNKIKVSKMNIVWNTGQTGSTIVVDPQSATTYSVTASYECFSTNAQINVQPCPPLTGSFPTNDFTWPNAFTPDGDGINDFYQIFHLGFNNFPAFNATEYKFTVHDRWGREIVRIEDQTDRCEGFVSGDLPMWDGRITQTYLTPWWNIFGPPTVHAGDMLPNGVYTWNFYLKNCTNTSWVHVIVNQSVTVIP